MIENSSSYPHPNPNPFSGLDEPRLSKWFLLTLSTLLSICNIVASLGIVWFERFGSDNKRIFGNKIVASISWAVIAWYVLVQPFEILLYFVRPLPEEFCYFSLILKNGLVVEYILFYDAIVVVRLFEMFD